MNRGQTVKEKVDIQNLHDLIKDIQNENWKAYVNFVKSGDMSKYNKDISSIVEEICSYPDKEVAKLVKEANDFFVCGWAIIVNEINTKRR